MQLISRFFKSLKQKKSIFYILCILLFFSLFYLKMSKFNNQSITKLDINSKKYLQLTQEKIKNLFVLNLEFLEHENKKEQMTFIESDFQLKNKNEGIIQKNIGRFILSVKIKIKSLKIVEYFVSLKRNIEFERLFKKNHVKPLPDYKFKDNLIYHAGGGLKNLTYTNSKESILNTISNGGKYIEVDISVSSDGIPVLIHDWNKSYIRRFANPLKDKNNNLKIPTLKEFKSFKTNDNNSQLSIHDLIKILDRYNHVNIVTDTKKDMYPLKFIATYYPSYKSKFIPQIYNKNQFFEIESLGFDKIIYTIYADATYPSVNEIVNFSKVTNITAVTFPKSYRNLKYKNLSEKLNLININSFIHTENTEEVLNSYILEGGTGVYTDWIRLK